MIKFWFLLFTTCLISFVSFAQIINVNTASKLQAALSNAVAGQTIVIADGVYDLNSGTFGPPIGINGTATQPITVIGSRNAVLTQSDTAHGYGFWFKGNKYWVLKGFTTRRCKNGIVVDSSQYITIDSAQSVMNGQAGINLRRYSSYCTVSNCYIDSCGLLNSGEGEGIYIGSANENWCTNTYCNIDTCNYNKILNNSFGDHVSSENVDIKEGTQYGLVSGNSFNGNGLSNINGGDSWIDAKGNHYTITNNKGNNCYLDGFQTHIKQPGWGNYNTFYQNTLNVNATGYGIRITTSSPSGTALNNIVCNNNIVTGASLGLTNITTTNCAPLATELRYWNMNNAGDMVLFNWKLNDVSTLMELVIEESANGALFSPLATITISSNEDYYTTRTNELKGVFFRLSMKYKDGNIAYSSVIYQEHNQSNTIKLYNNGNTLVAINNTGAEQQLYLYDIQGKEVYVTLLRTGSSNLLPPCLVKGLYIAKTIDKVNGKMHIMKIIK